MSDKQHVPNWHGLNEKHVRQLLVAGQELSHCVGDLYRALNCNSAAEAGAIISGIQVGLERIDTHLVGGQYQLADRRAAPQFMLKNSIAVFSYLLPDGKLAEYAVRGLEIYQEKICSTDNSGQRDRRWWLRATDMKTGQVKQFELDMIRPIPNKVAG